MKIWAKGERKYRGILRQRTSRRKDGERKKEKAQT